MTTLQKSLIVATLAACAGAGIHQAHRVTVLQGQVESLRQQQAPLVEQLHAAQQEQHDALRELAMLRQENERLNRNTGELLELRNEVNLLRGNQRAERAPATTAATGLSQTGPAQTRDATTTTTATDPAWEAARESGRAVGLAVVRGDPGALEQMTELAKAQLRSFSTNRVGLDDAQRAELSRLTFAPVRAAFEVIGEAAAQGNAEALAAVARAVQIPELRGQAVEVVGTLAGRGDEVALEMLIHPEQHGILLSSSVGALRAAADSGEQRAIDALSAVTRDPARRALWFMAASGLGKAAGSGNPGAIDALIGLLPQPEPSLRGAVLNGLRTAAANQNPNAAQALRSAGVE